MGFLGIAGLAIIAVYVYAQGRRGRVKDTPETVTEAKPPIPEQPGSPDVDQTQVG